MRHVDRPGRLDPASLGDQAAEAVRELNHVARDPDAFLAPADACQLISTLATMAGRLPQLLAQINSWLRAELAAGRLRVDTTAQTDGVIDTLTDLADCLAQATHCAHRLYGSLDSAQQRASHLAGAS